jgi:hypothetical protein
VNFAQLPKAAMEDASAVRMRKSSHHTQLALRRRTVSSRLSRLQVNPYKPLNVIADSGHYQLTSVQETGPEVQRNDDYVETNAVDSPPSPTYTQPRPDSESPIYSMPIVMNRSVGLSSRPQDRFKEIGGKKLILPEVKLIKELRTEQRARNAVQGPPTVPRP